MDDQPIESNQVEITNENILACLTSKNIKIRIQAYQRINDFPEHVKLLQNETLAIAVDAALSSLLSFSYPLCNEQVCKIYTQYSQPKTTIQSKISELVDRVFENNKEDAIDGLIEYFTYKNSKVIANCVKKLNSLVESNFSTFSNELKGALLTKVCPKLNQLFDNTDKDVKSAASALCVNLYKIFFDELLKFIQNIKPTILKDLNDAFATIEKPKREIKLNEFSLDSRDWKERLSAIEKLKNNISIMTNKNETVMSLNRILKDQVLSIVLVAVECVKIAKLNHPDLIRSMIERFKDKKPNLSMLITDTIKEIMPDPLILVDCLSNKNPEVKIGVLECLKLYNHVPKLSEIGKSTDDSVQGVRKAALELLSNLSSLEGLQEAHRLKLEKFKGEKAKAAAPVSNLSSNRVDIPTKVSISDRPQADKLGTSVSNAKDIRVNSNISSTNNSELLNISNFEFKVEERQRERISEEFLEKYPGLGDSDWRNRLDYLHNSLDKVKKEDPNDLACYLNCSKESNFQIISCFLGVFENITDFASFRTPLIAFLNSKITELKLKDITLKLYQRFDQDFLVNNFVNQIQACKTGKRMQSFCDVFGKVIISKHPLVDSFIDSFKPIAVADKQSFAKFKDLYSGLGVRSTNKLNAQVKEQMKQDIKPNIDQTLTTSENQFDIKNSYQNPGTDLKNDYLKPLSSVKISQPENPTPVKSDQAVSKANTNSSALLSIYKPNFIPDNLTSFNCSLNDIFTPEFIKFFNTDHLNAVKLLEQQDMVANSSAIILLYCTHSLPSPFFNSLILCFIRKRYILKKQEAEYLVGYLISNNMDSEVELLERVYPATKLYKIYRLFNSDQGTRGICTLIRDIKNISDLTMENIKRLAHSKEDLIEFSTAIEDEIKEQEKIKAKFKRGDIEEPVNGVKDSNRNSGLDETVNKSNLLTREANEQVVHNNDVYEQSRANNFGYPCTYQVPHEPSSQPDLSHTSVDQGRVLPNDGLREIREDQSINYGKSKTDDDALSPYDQAPKQKNVKSGSSCNTKLNINNLAVDDIVNEYASFSNEKATMTNSIVDERSKRNSTNFEDIEISNNSAVIEDSIVIDDDMASVLSNLENIEDNILPDTSFVIPEAIVYDGDEFTKEVEKSLENISITLTPVKKKSNFNISDTLITEIASNDISISSAGVTKLSNLFHTSPSSMTYCCNTAISTILAQLAAFENNAEFVSLCIDLIFRFTQNKDICGSLRYETLAALHKDFIPVVNGTSVKLGISLDSLENKKIADILINLCLNADISILKVYFDLISISDDVLMKLIWRHSKRINYSSREDTATIMSIVDTFFYEKSSMLAESHNIVIKVCLLHLKECVSVYSDNLKQFDLCSTTKRIIDLLISSRDLNIILIRETFSQK